MPVRAVLFDLDDTLLHHTRTSRQALSRVFTYQLEQQETTLERLCFLNDSIYYELFPRFLNGELTREQARAIRFWRMLKDCGQDATTEKSKQEQSEHLALAYEKAYNLERICIPGAVNLLRHLKNRVEVGILTNNPVQSVQDERLLEVPLEHWFVSGAVGLKKPDPKFFLYALEAVGCSPGDAVMVGDSWEKDVLGARGVGMRAVWFNPLKATSPLPEVSVLQSFEPLEHALSLLLER